MIAIQQTDRPDEIRATISQVERDQMAISVAVGEEWVVQLQISPGEIAIALGHDRPGEFVVLKRPGRKPGLFRSVPGAESEVLFLDESEIK